MKRFVETTLLTALMAVLCIAGCQKIETPNRSGTPNSSARVEKAMAAAGITVPEVATFLASRGWTIIPAAMPAPHWHRVNWSPSDNPAYYVWEMRGAIGDTVLPHYFPQVAGPYSLTVTAYRGNGTHSDPSLVGWSDNGTGSNALPGVRE